MYIGLSYDIKNAKGADKGKSEALGNTTVGNFQSNSFTNDELGLGIEVAYLERVVLRQYRWARPLLI